MNDKLSRKDAAKLLEHTFGKTIDYWYKKLGRDFYGNEINVDMEGRRWFFDREELKLYIDKIKEQRKEQIQFDDILPKEDKVIINNDSKNSKVEQIKSLLNTNIDIPDEAILAAIRAILEMSQ